jgi:hypothetical protein
VAYEATEESAEEREAKEFRRRNRLIVVALIWLVAILVGVATGSVPAGLAALLGGTGILSLVVTVFRVLRGESFFGAKGE